MLVGIKMKKRYYTYKEFEKDVKRIVDKLKRVNNGRDYTNIFPVMRGGMLLALRLSHLMKLPIITEKKYISKDTIIVEDVVDSGKNRILSFDRAGNLLHVFKAGDTLERPFDMVRTTDGALWCCDSFSFHRIRQQAIRIGLGTPGA